jgi:hypothetical protein
MLPLDHAPMNIRLTSSLTPEDENAIAPALLSAMSKLLDLLPIAYALRIETADSHVYQHVGEPAETPTTTKASNVVSFDRMAQ